MLAADAFSRHYAPILDHAYDVVDRLVVNAYFELAQFTTGTPFFFAHARRRREKRPAKRIR